MSEIWSTWRAGSRSFVMSNTGAGTGTVRLSEYLAFPRGKDAVPWPKLYVSWKNRSCTLVEPRSTVLLHSYIVTPLPNLKAQKGRRTPRNPRQLGTTGKLITFLRHWLQLIGCCRVLWTVGFSRWNDEKAVIRQSRGGWTVCLPRPNSTVEYREAFMIPYFEV